MYGNDVRRTLILGQYGTAVRSERNCSENTNVYGVRPITMKHSGDISISTPSCVMPVVSFQLQQPHTSCRCYVSDYLLAITVRFLIVMLVPFMSVFSLSTPVAVAGVSHSTAIPIIS